LTNLRRSRGYNFEYSIVNFFNSVGWHARRLGGSSTGLPDIVAVNNRHSVLYSIEAKSTASNYAYVPNDQLVRCQDILEMFEPYRFKAIVLAFKFTKKGKTPKGIIYNRRLQYYFHTLVYIENIDNIANVRCDYDTGKLTIDRCDKDVPVSAKYETWKKLEELEQSLFI
jgi:Holliday junction resolvase